MIMTVEIVARQQLRREALADRDNVTANQRLDLVVERVALAFQRVENHVMLQEQIADTASMKRLMEVSHAEKVARDEARALLRKALILARHWRAGPVCTRCEIEEDFGYCRCETAADE